METILSQITQMTGSYIPRLVGALLIIIIGWVVALLASGLFRKLLHRITLNRHVAEWISTDEKQPPPELENMISRGLFYLIMLFVLVATFQALGITLITEPINGLLNELFKFTPQILGALIIVVVAWVTAKVLKLVVARGLIAARFDEKLGDKTGIGEAHLALSQTVANAVFWLVMLLFCPAVLSTLNLGGLLNPVQNMLTKILDFLPNIFTAAIILLIGWLVARIIQRIVTSLLEAIGCDNLSEKVGLNRLLGSHRLSSILGLVAYVLIFIPILVASLNTLRLDAVTQPVSRMMELFLMALPNLFAAALILIVSYVVGKLLSDMLTNLLEGLGFNAVLAKLGIGQKIVEGTWAPSVITGKLALAAIMLFASIEASERLGFKIASMLFTQFTVLAGHVLLGIVIFAIGLLLANFTSKIIISTTSSNPRLFSLTARTAIMVLAGAMALRQMGLANEIINLAFGLTLGAIAIAIAIAFGCGGKEIAARELDEWIRSMKDTKP